TIAPPATTSATGSSFGTRRSLGKVEPDREAGPVVGERHARAVAMRDGPHQAEAEPVAGRAAARLEPYKPIEYALALGFGDARPAIPHLQHRMAVPARHRDPDP